uniref:Uncharacterized protein n=1 Tax=Syphacia muris TaxID=451379 RepID=A0A0N5B1K1_9BILA
MEMQLADRERSLSICVQVKIFYPDQLHICDKVKILWKLMVIYGGFIGYCREFGVSKRFIKKM